jgi:hypothetical protein
MHFVSSDFFRFCREATFAERQRALHLTRDRYVPGQAALSAESAVDPYTGSGAYRSGGGGAQRAQPQASSGLDNPLIAQSQARADSRFCPLAVCV